MSHPIRPDAIYPGRCRRSSLHTGRTAPGFCAVLDRSRHDGRVFAHHVADPERWPNGGLHTGDARCLASVLSRWTLSRLSATRRQPAAAGLADAGARWRGVATHPCPWRRRRIRLVVGWTTACLYDRCRSGAPTRRARCEKGATRQGGPAPALPLRHARLAR